jgi:hypothetical protein
LLADLVCVGLRWHFRDLLVLHPAWSTQGGVALGFPY